MKTTEEFKPVKSVSGLIIAIAFVVIGVLMMVLSHNQGVDITGVILVICGPLLWALSKPDYKYGPDEILMKRHDVYFWQEDMEEIEKCLEKGDFKQLEKLKNKGQNMMLQIFVAKDKSLAIVKIFNYVPYEYVPLDVTYTFKGAQVAALPAL